MITRILNSIANNYLQQNIARRRRRIHKALNSYSASYLKCARAGPGGRKTQRLSPAARFGYLNLEAKAVLEQIVNVDNQLMS